jgi:putative CocE/NonD family hydrolase
MNRRLTLAALTVLLLSLVGIETEARAANVYEIRVDRGVEARMRDGVVLRADVYRPKLEGKLPVILTRTPYNKAVYPVDFAMRAAAHGYVAIIQDCRGRYTSDGTWEPFKYESNDGYDTVEWAASLPYSNGKVGMYGASYVGVTQMLTAIAAPPHLAGIFPIDTGSNYHDNWIYQGGAFEQWFDESWTSGSLSQDTMDRLIGQNRSAGLDSTWLTKLPLGDFTGVNLQISQNLASALPYFNDWLKHPQYDDYWKQWSIDEHQANIKVPAYHVGAWYDIFFGGTLRNYVGIKANGGTEEARRGQRLLITIGGHAGGGRKVGEVDFGPETEVDVDAIVLRWYDHLLKGIDNGIDREKPVKIFIMGANRWRDENDWPPPEAHQARFYLHSAGHANSSQGDGSLSAAKSGEEAADRFVYDPANPVPTHGGPLCCPMWSSGQPMQGQMRFAAHLAPGPLDQRMIEERQDVLVYSTPSLKQDFEVTGPVTSELYVSSSAKDTDFTAKLIDVRPDGMAVNVAEGIMRARYRKSQEHGELLNPGEVYKLTVDLWATSNVFKAGHRLRLEIASSNFPRFDRNLNTAEDPERGTRMVKATNTIYHDAQHPSSLVLSVLEH